MDADEMRFKKRFWWIALTLTFVFGNWIVPDEQERHIVFGFFLVFIAIFQVGESIMRKLEED